MAIVKNFTLWGDVINRFVSNILQSKEWTIKNHNNKKTFVKNKM